MIQKLMEIEKNITDHNHDKTDFNNKLSSLNRKIVSNKTKYLVIENALKKLKTFDSGYFVIKAVLKIMMVHKIG